MGRGTRARRLGQRRHEVVTLPAVPHGIAVTAYAECSRGGRAQGGNGRPRAHQTGIRVEPKVLAFCPKCVESRSVSRSRNMSDTEEDGAFAAAEDAFKRTTSLPRNKHRLQQIITTNPAPRRSGRTGRSRSDWCGGRCGCRHHSPPSPPRCRR